MFFFKTIFNKIKKKKIPGTYSIVGPKYNLLKQFYTINFNYVRFFTNYNEAIIFYVLLCTFSNSAFINLAYSLSFIFPSS